MAAKGAGLNIQFIANASTPQALSSAGSRRRINTRVGQRNENRPTDVVDVRAAIVQEQAARITKTSLT